MSDPRDFFFVDRTLRNIAGKPVDDQLGMLREAVIEAEHDKACGYGPPETEVNRLRRKYVEIVKQNYGRAA